MKTTLVLFFIMFSCALSVLSLAEDNGKPAATVAAAESFSGQPTPKPTTHKPTTHKPTTHKPTTHKPTTHKPTTHKPTTHKPTTHKPTTTTTHKPTTPKPTTTTPKPTTTTPKPTTTTPKPTTTAPVTTAPSPSTVVPVGKYNLTKDKQVCVMADIGLKIRLVTAKNNGSFTIQPNMTKAKGDCKDPTANLTLAFPQGFVTFLFNKNVSGNNVYVKELSFELNYPLNKAAANSPYKASNKTRLFVARIGRAYSCKEESIFMGNGLYLDVSQDNIQAFNFSKSNEFGSRDLCPADQPNYKVAIAVGVTLLVLIIIVVVAYLVGRRRRSDGYQSL